MLAAVLLVASIVAALWLESKTADRSLEVFLDRTSRVSIGSSQSELADLDRAMPARTAPVPTERNAWCRKVGGTRVKVYEHEYQGLVARLMRRNWVGRDQFWVCLDSAGQVVKTGYIWIVY